MLKSIFILLILILSLQNSKGATHYVSMSGSDNNTGTSWASAFATLQKALDMTKGNDTIFVSEGKYVPTYNHGVKGYDVDLIRARHFRLKNGVFIFGGFPDIGNPTMSNRDWKKYETILSGDINGDDFWNEKTNEWENIDDNTYLIFYHPKVTRLNNYAVLDGFTLSGGNANGFSARRAGAAMHNISVAPSIRNCTFIGNYALDGGAISNIDSSPIFTNCIFKHNKALRYGGVVSQLSSYASFTNCIFQNNMAIDGGVIHNENSSSKFTNCLIVENYAERYGGCMFTQYGNNSFSNCTISNNAAGRYGGGFYLSYKTKTNIHNSILWENYTGIVGNDSYGIIHPFYGNGEATFSYSTISDYPSDIVGITNISNSIYLEPHFAGRSNPNEPYSLTSISPCINAGLNDNIDLQYDIRGNGFDRIKEGIIDMGAYEFHHGIDPLEPNYIVLYVKANAKGNNDGLSWENAMLNLQEALDFAYRGDEIWVAEGIYNPTKTVGGLTNKYKTYQMKNSVEIYGGFPSSGEPSMEERDWTKYKTILSGDHNNDDTWNEKLGMWENRDDNSMNVFYHAEGVVVGRFASLDGFEIFGGHTGGINPQIGGGGMLNYYSSPRISNCIFRGNVAGFAGGAIYGYYCHSLISNCTFINNFASFYGGAVYVVRDSYITFNNCKFIGNRSNSAGGAIYNSKRTVPTYNNCKFAENISEDGGAMFNWTSQVKINNSLFYDNYAIFNGGAINHNTDLAYVWNNNMPDFDTTKIINCTFTNNRADMYGGAVYNTSPINLKIYNSILWNNKSNFIANEVYSFQGMTEIDNSCIIDNQDNLSGSYIIRNSISTDPMFIGSGKYPYLINGQSPLVDAGNNNFVVSKFDKRGEGFPRMVDSKTGETGIVDIGAYEYQFGKDPVPVIEQIDNDEIISIYPNPSQGEFTLNINNNKFNDTYITISIYNLNGEIVNTLNNNYLQNGEKLILIDNKGLATGEYYVVIDFGEGDRLTKKVKILK